MSTSNTSTNSAFLHSFPPEIRNMIYKLVLVSDRPLEVSTDLKSAPILSTCSQIRKEAIGIAFDNKFKITCGTLSAAHLKAWVRALGENARLVKHIEVDFGLAGAAKDEHQRLRRGWDVEPRNDWFQQRRWFELCRELNLTGHAFARALFEVLDAGGLAHTTISMRALHDNECHAFRVLRIGLHELIRKRGAESGHEIAWLAAVEDLTLYAQPS